MRVPVDVAACLHLCFVGARSRASSRRTNGISSRRVHAELRVAIVALVSHNGSDHLNIDKAFCTCLFSHRVCVYEYAKMRVLLGACIPCSSWDVSSVDQGHGS